MFRLFVKRAEKCVREDLQVESCFISRCHVSMLQTLSVLPSFSRTKERTLKFFFLEQQRFGKTEPQEFRGGIVVVVTCKRILLIFRLFKK